MTTAKDGKRYPLTLKQQNFCRAYTGEAKGNASEAYRIAYDAENMGDNAIYVEASRLMDDPKIALRVDSLQSEARERHKTTVDSITATLREAQEIARNGGNASALTAAALGEAKLHGLLVDKTEEVKPVETMTPDELEAESERLRAELDGLRADNVVKLH